MKEVKRLGQLLNDAVMNPVSAARQLRSIDVVIDRIARRETGVLPFHLDDERYEEDVRVLRYWELKSSLLAKVYMSAAQQLTCYEGFDK